MTTRAFFVPPGVPDWTFVRAGLSLLAILLLIGPFPAASVGAGASRRLSQTPPAKIAAGAWAATSDGAEATVLVLMAAQADLSGVEVQSTREMQGAAVRDRLWETAERAQASLRAWLDRRGISYRAFYIVNALSVEADRATLQTIARRPEVARVLSNPRVRVSLPEPDVRLNAEAASVPWGVQRIGAPDAWALGFQGQGVVVAGQDTGYDWDHLALVAQYRGWDGETVSHDYHWHDAIHSGGGSCGPDASAPCDDHGHGTHTMGTMVGDVGPDARIGVAPAAEWIGCRNMSVGVGTPATYAECFEFFLAPYPVGAAPDQGDPTKAPDVINNSWTCPYYEGCDAEHTAFLRGVVEAVRAAGILVVASAGNTGSGCRTIVDPPAEFDAALSVGATSSASDDRIASFSSRGPVDLRIAPDLSAPGVGVYSSYPNGAYGTSSGTSMAAPHVVGAAALLMSADPDLRGDVAAVEHLLTRTSVPRIDTTCGGEPSGVPNNVYGWGRLDVTSALQLGQLEGIVRDQEGVSVLGSLVEGRDLLRRVGRTFSGGGGLYSFSLVSGTYTVTASLDGGPLATYSGIRVTADRTTTLDLTLPISCVGAVGMVFETVPSEPWLGEPIQFTGSLTAASLPVTYTWDVGDGSPIRTGNPVTHTYSHVPISQTFTVVMTATNRCSSGRVARALTIRAYRWYFPLLFKTSL